MEDAEPTPSTKTARAAEPPLQEASDFSSNFKVFRFEALARCGEEIWIENDGQLYRLRRTRQGKLILTK